MLFTDTTAARSTTGNEDSTKSSPDTSGGNAASDPVQKGK